MNGVPLRAVPGAVQTGSNAVDGGPWEAVPETVRIGSGAINSVPLRAGIETARIGSGAVEGSGAIGGNVVGNGVPLQTVSKAGRIGSGGAAASVESGGIPQSGNERASGGQVLRYPGRDAEIERLRRIEANYERDKAVLAKEKKAPALARSESRDIGHAEGGGEEITMRKAVKQQLKDIAEELRRRQGV